jgi:hypothetical protein
MRRRVYSAAQNLGGRVAFESRCWFWANCGRRLSRLRAQLVYSGAPASRSTRDQARNTYADPECGDLRSRHCVRIVAGVGRRRIRIVMIGNPSSVDPDWRTIALTKHSAGPKADVGELLERARREVADLLERASRDLSAAGGRIGHELEELVERAADEVSTAAGRVGSDVEGLADRAHDEVAGAVGRVGLGLGRASKKTRRTTRRTSRRLRRKAKRTATTTREQVGDGLEIAREEGFDALRANQRVLAVVAAAASAAIVALVAKSKKSTGNGPDDLSSSP